MHVLNVYSASELVKEHFLKTVTSTTAQTKAFYGISDNGKILRFESRQQAVHIAGGAGYLFELMYRNGEVEITPFS